MTRIEIITLSLLLFLPGITRAQTYCDSTLIGRRISDIVVLGNEKTRAATVLREMDHKKGDPVEITTLEADRKRIQNLNLFNRVVIVCDEYGEDVLVRVAVTEQWYLIPYPIVFINDKDWSKWSYGAGLIYNNFRGRAETLDLSFWLGYDPAVHFDYYNPWIGGKQNLFGGFGIFYSIKRNKHFAGANVDVRERHTGGRVFIGKRFDLFLHLSLVLGYKELTLSPSVEGQTLSENGRDRLPSAEVTLSWDKRDLKEYPHRGWYTGISVRKVGWPGLDANYLRYGWDMRGYLPLFLGTTLAVRYAANMSEGRIPVYEHVFLGYSERIRGYFHDTFEGENRMTAGASYRFPIIPIRYFNLAPYPELSNLKFGISGGIFIDTGLVWYQTDRLSDSRLITGYGGGIHVHLPYINVLRLELGINARGRVQFLTNLDVDI